LKNDMNLTLKSHLAVNINPLWDSLQSLFPVHYTSGSSRMSLTFPHSRRFSCLFTQEPVFTCIQLFVPKQRECYNSKIIEGNFLTITKINFPQEENFFPMAKISSCTTQKNCPFAKFNSRKNLLVHGI